MWLTGIDEYEWSFYLTNFVAIILNATILVALLNRIWTTRTVDDNYTVLTRIAKGILCVAAFYQVILSISRISHLQLPLEYRDTWIMKDVGIFVYVLSITLLHRKIMSGKVAPYDDNTRRAAQARSMETAMEVGLTNHDERLRNKRDKGE